MKRYLLNGDKELHFLLAYELDKPERMSAFIQTADLWESPYWGFGRNEEEDERCVT